MSQQETVYSLRFTEGRDGQKTRPSLLFGRILLGGLGNNTYLCREIGMNKTEAKRYGH